MAGETPIIENNKPLVVHRMTVPPDWIDFNGHVNVAYYVLGFDYAADAMFDFFDFGDDYRKRHQMSTFAVEAHIVYARELKEGDPLRFEIQALDLNEKALHYMCLLYHDTENYLAATAEWLSLSMDMRVRRPAPFNEETYRSIAALYDAQKDMPRPAQAGRVVGIRRKQPAA